MPWLRTVVQARAVAQAREALARAREALARAREALARAREALARAREARVPAVARATRHARSRRSDR
ncbi:MAG TPA: hypothetical protein VEF89_30715 [Solirubrobacteraceae bacterium]|nr:hypothetical protein [Solirubrobacteraceae bacterium]